MRSPKQTKFINALEHNPNFANSNKVKNKKSFNSLNPFDLPVASQSEAMNPTQQFKKLRSKLKY